KLAIEGREDAEALAVLRLAAGKHIHDLTRAAAFTRLSKPVSDHRASDLANRLLLAAASNLDRVPEVSQDRELWFQKIDAFTALPVDEAYAQLSELSLELSLFERTVKALRSEMISEIGNLGSEQENILWMKLVRDLSPIVGPDARTHDPLL